MISSLYKQNNYLIDARFLKSINIMEYDISKANISILYQKGKISKEYYDYLYRLPKLDREKDIGLMIGADKVIYDTIKEGIVEAKYNLFKYNNIQNHEVIRISNDAVFVVRNTPLEYTKFGNIEFKLKNNYSTFMRLDRLTFLFKTIMGDIDLMVYGLGSDQFQLHLNHMLSFIGNLLYMVDCSNIQDTMGNFLNFYNQYLNRKLDIGFYRELNPDSMFVFQGPNRSFGISTLDNTCDKSRLDISYNANVLRELYGILAELHQRGI